MEVFPDNSSETSGKEIKETPGEESDRKIDSMKSEKSSAEAPVPEETKASLITDEPGVSKLHKANVIAANASSTISQEGTSNSPILLFVEKMLPTGRREWTVMGFQRRSVSVLMISIKLNILDLSLATGKQKDTMLEMQIV